MPADPLRPLPETAEKGGDPAILFDMLVGAKVVLASASPRRRCLLEAACLCVDVRPTCADETWPGGPISAGVQELARRKLVALGPVPETVISADTVVALGDTPLGKPANETEATEMLSRLSARRHSVLTGFCVRRGERVKEGVVTTSIWFRSLCSEEILRYVKAEEPFDKAGAYAIQEGGGAFVERVEGSYTNVVGLPLAEVLRAVTELGWT